MKCISNTKAQTTPRILRTRYKKQSPSIPKTAKSYKCVCLPGRGQGYPQLKFLSLRFLYSSLLFKVTSFFSTLPFSLLFSFPTPIISFGFRYLSLNPSNVFHVRFRGDPGCTFEMFNVFLLPVFDGFNCHRNIPAIQSL